MANIAAVETITGRFHPNPELSSTLLGPLVLVNLDPNAISLSEIAGDLATDWLETVPDLPELRVARHDPRVVQDNWKFVLDQMECYHCPHLHKGAGFGSMAKTQWITEEHDFYAKHTIHANPDELQDDPGIIPVAGPEDQYQNTKFIWYLWPGLIFVADRGRPNFKVMRVMPRGLEQSSHEVTNMCRNVPPTDEDVAGMNFYRDVILPQDVAAMEKQQQGIRSRGFSQGRLMVDAARSIKSEHSTHHFDKLVWEALNGPNYVSRCSGCRREMFIEPGDRAHGHLVEQRVVDREVIVAIEHRQHLGPRQPLEQLRRLARWHQLIVGDPNHADRDLDPFGRRNRFVTEHVNKRFQGHGERLLIDLPCHRIGDHDFEPVDHLDLAGQGLFGDGVAGALRELLELVPAAQAAQPIATRDHRHGDHQCTHAIAVPRRQQGDAAAKTGPVQADPVGIDTGPRGEKLQRMRGVLDLLVGHQPATHTLATAKAR